jgi:hypothetical protein
MSIPIDQPVYRVRKYYRKGDLPRKYRHSLEMTDDRTQQVMATCELVGQACFATLAIVDHQEQTWQMKPNRKIMPSRWIVTDPRQQIAMQFDQKILGKLVNPIHRVILALLDGEDKEVYRLVDPRTSVPDRILGSSPGECALMDGEKLVARLVWLPKQKDQPADFWGKLKAFLTSSDRGIISSAGSHVLPAPVALGMLMIFEDLTNTSAG